MPKFFHIVQVHPVENGEPNLCKVECEVEFASDEEAVDYVKKYNAKQQEPFKAVYVGMVNDETGELV